MPSVILASASPRRLQLLTQAGVHCTVVPSNIPEHIAAVPSVEHGIIQLARRKAEAVARHQRDALIIAADTVVLHQGKIIGKPRNLTDAQRILKQLSNTTHTVITAIAVIDTGSGRRFVDIDRATIVTRALTPHDIALLAQRNLDKAGAYAVQHDKDILVKEIRGDYYTVVGLPVKKLGRILRIFGIALRGND